MIRIHSTLGFGAFHLVSAVFFRLLLSWLSRLEVTTLPMLLRVTVVALDSLLFCAGKIDGSKIVQTRVNADNIFRGCICIIGL